MLRSAMRFTARRTLNLSGSHVGGPVPNEIGNLTELRVLDLHGNRLDDQLPESFWQLTKLEDIDLSGNGRWQISVPPKIGNLANLERINLAGVIIGEVPSAFGTLTKLKSLRICTYHRLTVDIAILTALVNLEELCVSEMGDRYTPPLET